MYDSSGLNPACHPPPSPTPRFLRELQARRKIAKEKIRLYVLFLVGTVSNNPRWGQEYLARNQKGFGHKGIMAPHPWLMYHGHTWSIWAQETLLAAPTSLYVKFSKQNLIHGPHSQLHSNPYLKDLLGRHKAYKQNHSACTSQTLQFQSLPSRADKGIVFRAAPETQNYC